MMPFTIPNTSATQVFPSTGSKRTRHWDIDDPQPSSPSLHNKTLKRVATDLPVRSSRRVAPAASPHIPIPSSSDSTFHHHQQQQQDLIHEQQQLADYRDYVFFHRVVHGIRQTQRKSRDASRWFLYHQNEECLSHVIKIRQLEDPHSVLASTNYDEDSSVCLHDSVNENDDDNETCIFHLEL
jgi:hypothetical protein